MKVLYLDTETSSLNGKIIQMAYIIIDDGEILAGKNLYCCVDEINPLAQAVHGITVDKLKELSEGKDFSFYKNIIYNDFQSADLIIGHNCSFDIRILKKEFAAGGLNLNVEGKTFCTQSYFTNICKIKHHHFKYKKPKLVELAEYYGIGDEEISDCCRQIFNCTAGSHDARYDVSTVYLVCKKSNVKITI